MGEFRASLYDIFGYLIPGFIALLAFRLIPWVIFYPNKILDISPLSNLIVISVIGIFSYIIGHFIHAIGNWLPFTKSVSLDQQFNQNTYFNIPPINNYLENFRISLTIMTLVDEALKRTFGPEYLKLSRSEKFDIIDEFRVLNQKENERDMFTYREGFYRGMVISLGFLLLPVALSMFYKTFAVNVGKIEYPVLLGERFLVLLAILIAIIGFWRRMIRFSYYRTRRAIALFLVLSKSQNNG